MSIVVSLRFSGFQWSRDEVWEDGGAMGLNCILLVVVK